MTSRDIALAAALEASTRGVPLQEALGGMIEASALEARDRALASEIAFGALRRRLQLELALSRVVTRPVEKMQPALAEALRQGAYQVLFLDRVPARAAVNETVGIVKAHMGRGPASFANAALRAVGRLVRKKTVDAGKLADPRAALASREGRFLVLAEEFLPDPESDEAGWLAGAYGYPKWMVERWFQRHGRERAEAILEWGNTPPGLSVRLNPLRTSPWPLGDDEAARVFRGCRAFAPGEVAGTYSIDAEGAPGELPGFAEGLYTIQDQTQARPARMLAPPGGARVLDLCCGLGGKTMQLAEIVGPGGSVTALDIDPAKVARAREAAERLGLENITFLEGDALDPPPGATGEYEYVLVDAPCSNLGALDRRPEVRFRAKAKSIRALAGKETELLRAGLARLAPGGVLVYSVCSFEEEEATAVVRACLDGREDMSLTNESWVLPEAGHRGRVAPGSFSGHVMSAVLDDPPVSHGDSVLPARGESGATSRPVPHNIRRGRVASGSARAATRRGGGYSARIVRDTIRVASGSARAATRRGRAGESQHE